MAYCLFQQVVHLNLTEQPPYFIATLHEDRRLASISRLTKLFDLDKSALTFQVGIERETLRVTQDSKLSQKPHPESLGSALTHSAITTDYSESLVEFITGVHDNKESLTAELDELHRFSNAQLDNEHFWAASMPSPLPEQEQPCLSHCSLL